MGERAGDGSAVKDPYFSSRGLRFSFQAPTSSGLQPLTPVPENLTFSGLFWHQHTSGAQKHI